MAVCIQNNVTDSRTIQEVEHSLREEFQRRFAEHEARTAVSVEQWKLSFMQQMQDLMKTQLEAAFGNLNVQDTRPTKKRKSPVQSTTKKSCTTKACRICGEHGPGRDVHRHRELGINLDGKCRKQVDTFKHGGAIQERREEWAAALKDALHSELSQKMRASLGMDAELSEAPSTFSSASSHSFLSSENDNMSNTTASHTTLPVHLSATVGSPTVPQPLNVQALNDLDLNFLDEDCGLLATTCEDDMVRTFSDDMGALTAGILV